MKFDDAKPRTGRDSAKLEDLVDLLKLPNNKWTTIRLLDVDIMPVKQHWVNIIAGKDKREIKIPKICIAFDPATESNKKGVHCPYCDLAGGDASPFYLANVLVRKLQEDEPNKKPKLTKEEKESGFKDPDSNSWTPVQVLRITASLAKKIQGLKDLNKHKIKGETKKFSVSHPKFGADINVKHDKDAKGAEQYQVNIGDKVALTEDELTYLIHPLTEELLDNMGRETEKEANAEVKRMQIVGDDEMPEDEDDDEELGSKSKSKKSKTKPKSGAKSKSKNYDAEDEDDEDEDDEDEDERPTKSKSKTKAKSKSKYDEDDEDEDDEDEDDEDEDDEDEDERPTKSKSKSKAKSSSKSKYDEDEDEDADAEDEDDEDEDEDDEDEDDERPAKSKSKATTKSKSGAKSKSKNYDDDEDAEDEDEEDDDEDERPVKSKAKTKAKSKASPAKTKGKKKPSDDYDDDIPF